MEKNKSETGRDAKKLEEMQIEVEFGKIKKKDEVIKDGVGDRKWKDKVKR